VGTGFHPELTGRENVYLNGAIYGMNKEEVTRKFDEIVAFSGVEKFIDTPVKRYSSGMYVRLGFAVAAHLDPEILIVDEVLAVGDAEFQKKCLGKMSDVAGEGRTVLFVSHNMVSMRNLCSRTMLLKDGKIVNAGPTDEIISDYLHVYQRPSEFIPNEDQRLGNHRIRIQDFSVEPASPVTGRPFACRVDVENLGNTSITAEFSISFTAEDGSKVFQMHSGHVQKGISSKPGYSYITSNLESLFLAPGKYGVNLWVGSGKMTFDWVPDAYSFEVRSGTFQEGIYVDARGYPVIMPAKWKQFDN
ncbi:MAG: Wzt carbohydrate-binding domain-containing protein, partial [Dehalobacter sp.]|nr:Wzt carbohydrate-binding domain-containing protein [Dehalobacter sp.]